MLAVPAGPGGGAPGRAARWAARSWRLGNFYETQTGCEVPPSGPGGEPLKNGLQTGDALLLLAVTVVLVAAGSWRFNRRDVAV